MRLEQIELKDACGIERKLYATSRGWAHYVDLRVMKPPLGALILHGFGKSRTHRPLVDLAEAIFGFGQEKARIGRIVSPDFRGHGESDGDLVDFTIASALEDATAAFNMLVKQSSVPAERVAIVGHSIGALVAVMLHNRLGGKTGRLVLISPAIQQNELIKLWYNEAERNACHRHGFLDTKHGRIGWEYFREALCTDWLAQLEQVKSPVLILRGKGDEDVPREYHRAVAEKLGHRAKFVEIANGDHNFESQPAKEAMIKETLAFLAEGLI